MARFLRFKCQKCGQEFQLMTGPVKSSIKAGTPEREINRRARENVEKLFNELRSHGKECREGRITLEGLGFAD